MGIMDKISDFFNSGKNRKEGQNRSALWAAKQAEVIARCYKSEEELAAENIIQYDNEDEHVFEEWAKNERENLPYYAYGLAVLQNLRDDIKIEDVPYLKDRERFVLETIDIQIQRALKGNNSGDYKDITRLLDEKSLYDETLFKLIQQKANITNLPWHNSFRRYLESYGLELKNIDISYGYNNISTIYSDPRVLEAFPQAKTQIEQFIDDMSANIYDTYRQGKSLLTIVDTIPELQNTETAKNFKDRYTAIVEGIEQHNLRVSGFDNLSQIVNIINLSDDENFQNDVHLTLYAATAQLFTDHSNINIYPMNAFNDYAEKYPEQFLNLPEPFLHHVVERTKTFDISFSYSENEERHGFYLNDQRGFDNGFYDADMHYDKLKLLIDRGYGSKEAREAVIERLKTIEEAHPRVIDAYNEKFGAFINFERSPEVSSQTLDSVKNHNDYVGDFLRQEDNIDENGSKNGTKYYLSEDGVDYVVLKGDENSPTSKELYKNNKLIEEDSYIDGIIASRSRKNEDNSEEFETFNHETGKRTTYEIVIDTPLQNLEDPNLSKRKERTLFYEDGETVKLHEFYYIEADKERLIDKTQYNIETKRKTTTHFADDGQPATIVTTNENNVTHRVEHYKNGKLWETYQSADDESHAYGPGHIFEAYTENGILESVCRFDDKNNPAETTYYESDGETISKIEYEDTDNKKIKYYQNGKFAYAELLDDKGNPLPKDELYEEVLQSVVETQSASSVQLQRKFSIGYNRARKLIDLLEANEVIGPEQEDGEPRPVLINELPKTDEITLGSQTNEDLAQADENELSADYFQAQDEAMAQYNSDIVDAEAARRWQEQDEIAEQKREKAQKAQGIANVLSGLADNARILEELERQSATERAGVTPAPTEAEESVIPTVDENESSLSENETLNDSHAEENEVSHIPYNLAEREVYLNNGIDAYRQRLNNNGFPAKGRNAKFEAKKKELLQTFAFEFVNDKIAEYEEISDADLLQIMKDLTVRKDKDIEDDNGQVVYSADDIKETLQDLSDETFYRLQNITDMSAEHLQTLKELTKLNAELYQDKNDGRSKQLFGIYTDGEKNLDDIIKTQGALQDLNDKRIVDSPEAAPIASEQQNEDITPPAPVKSGKDNLNPLQKWEEELKTILEKNDIHALLSFAADALRHPDFKDYKYPGKKNNKINALAWLNDHVNFDELPEHLFEDLTTEDISNLDSLAKTRIEEIALTRRGKHSRIGIQDKMDNVFVRLMLVEAKKYMDHAKEISEKAKEERERQALAEKLEQWKDLFGNRFRENIYVDEVKKDYIKDLILMLDKEIAKLPRAQNVAEENNLSDIEETGGHEPNASEEETGHEPNAPEEEAGHEPNAPEEEAGHEPNAPEEETGHEPNAPEEEAGHESNAPEEEAGHEPNAPEEEGENDEERTFNFNIGGVDENGNLPPPVPNPPHPNPPVPNPDPVPELDDFDELVVNHAAEPEITPSVDTLANLIEQKCLDKEIVNQRENDNFKLFEKEEDKATPEKSNGQIMVHDDSNLNIISTEFKVYQAAVEAAKEKGAKKIEITSNQADGTLRDLSDSEAGIKNRQALAHLFLACAKAGLEADASAEIIDAVKDYPEYNMYVLNKEKENAYKELSEKLNGLSDPEKNEYRLKKEAFSSAPDDAGKRAAQAELLRFETDKGIAVLKQNVKDKTRDQYNYYIVNGQHYGEETTDTAKAERKNQLKETIDKYQNQGGYYKRSDDNVEAKGNKALEIAMYKRLMNDNSNS